MDEKTRQQIHEAIADHEAAHPGWREERREAMEREARAAQARARKAVQTRQQEQRQLRQRVDANNTQAWCSWVDERIAAAMQADRESQVRVFGEVISIERARHRKELKTAVDEVTRAFETKMKALEDRLWAQPGQLPMSQPWVAESVTYRGGCAMLDGSTYQAKKDTAQRPPGPDWLLIARSGRDAVMPHVRGTYSADQEYKLLDIVALDGAAFVATRDNAKICPGPGWQLLCKQGKAGRKGEKGDPGPRGEKGDTGPAVMPQLISSKIDENYTLTILRSDNSLEIIPLREAFERFLNEIGGG